MQDSASLHITSLSNPRVKDIVRLRQRSHRDKTGALLIEGYREIVRALDNDYRPWRLMTCADFFMGLDESQLIARCVAAGAVHTTCTPPVFEKISARERPDGLLAVGPQIHRTLAGLTLPPNALVIVTEALEKPGNLGAVLRSADAAGTAAVIVCDFCTDIQNPNVVRASLGTLFSVPVVTASSAAAVAYLHERDFRILAATPHADAFYSDYDLTGNTAVIVGSEQSGLSDIWLDPDVTTSVRIPMLGQCDSLNVASAATILLYEAVRQRVTKDRSIVPPPHAHGAGGGDDLHGGNSGEGERR